LLPAAAEVVLLLKSGGNEVICPNRRFAVRLSSSAMFPEHMVLPVKLPRSSFLVLPVNEEIGIFAPLKRYGYGDKGIILGDTGCPDRRDYGYSGIRRRGL
jgi:hypothetical protein